MKKKLVVAGVVMTMALGACSNEEQHTEDNTQSSAASTETTSPLPHVPTIPADAEADPSLQGTIIYLMGLAQGQGFDSEILPVETLQQQFKPLGNPPGWVFSQETSDVMSTLVYLNGSVDLTQAAPVADNLSISAVDVGAAVSDEQFAEALNSELESPLVIEPTLEKGPNPQMYRLAAKGEMGDVSIDTVSYYWLSSDRSVVYRVTVAYDVGSEITSDTEDWIVNKAYEATQS